VPTIFLFSIGSLNIELQRDNSLKEVFVRSDKINVTDSNGSAKFDIKTMKQIPLAWWTDVLKWSQPLPGVSNQVWLEGPTSPLRARSVPIAHGLNARQGCDHFSTSVSPGKGIASPFDIQFLHSIWASHVTSLSDRTKPLQRSYLFCQLNVASH